MTSLAILLALLPAPTLGAKGVCIAGTNQTRSEVGGPLGGAQPVPGGTYQSCVLVRP